MLSPDLIKALAYEAAEATTPSSRARVLNEWAKSFGISLSTIRRALNRAGIKPTRISGGGRPREHSIGDPQMEQIVGQIVQTIRKNGKKIMGVREAIRAAELRGLIPEGSISPSQVRYWMKQQDYLVRDLMDQSPTGQLRSDYPNQVQQIDASYCLQWEFPSAEKQLKYLNEHTGMKILSIDRGMGRNKIVEVVKERLKNGRKIILRLAGTDHFSGLIYVKYYELSGESAVATVEFLWDFWSTKMNPGMVFCGLPEYLICDPGPGNKSQVVGNLCRNYGVKLRLHQSGHPWAKGQVETSHNIVETHFECFFTANPPRDLADLNARAEIFQARWNANQVLRRNGQPVATRNQLWSTITAQQLRVPASLAEFQMASYRSIEEATVTHQGIIKVRVVNGEPPRFFQAPAEFGAVFGRGKLKVIVNPFVYRDRKSVLVGIDDTDLRMAAEVAVVAGGFLATARSIVSVPRALTNKQENFRRKASEMVLPMARLEEMSNAEQYGIAAQAGVPMARTVRPSSIGEVRYSASQAADRIYEALPGIPLRDRAAITESLSGTYTDDQISSLIARYRESYTRVRATLAAG